MHLRAGREQWLCWGMLAAVLAATFVTYWRLEPAQTYNFEDSGVSGAFSRSITYLSFPVSLAAIGLLLATGRRDRYAFLAVTLCAIAVVPGVNRSSDLTAQWANVPVAAGALLAAFLCLRARPSPRSFRLDRLRLALIAALVLFAFPWITASAGFYADSIPGLAFIQAAEPTPGRPDLASVHHGLHEGLFGVQLAVVALVGSAALRGSRRLLRAYFSLMFVYGVMVAAADGWLEQVVKRGWTDQRFPNPLEPGLTAAWALLLVGAAVVYLAWFGRRRQPISSPVPAEPASAVATPAASGR